MSLSARRAWIEITYVIRLPPCQVVALRKESVDRNSVGIHRFADVLVALRKESVDRNNAACIPARPASKSLSARRAWIEISHSCIIMDKLTSLSARRAWIEILWQKQKMQLLQVALRKESVDRNSSAWPLYLSLPPSLSARRAWIESMMSSRLAMLCVVALRKESVDRNYRAHGAAHRALSRSPQGERG